MTRRPQQRADGSGWYRISNAGPGPAQILIYDVIGLWGVTAADFIRDLGAVNGPVEVRINSAGGDVFEAYAIYNALASRLGVTTVVDSLAASSASVIAMAGEQRLAAKTSQLMIHEAWAGADGGADDMRSLANRLDTVSGQIAQVYADTAGGGLDHWRGLMRDETWFTPQQALDAGLITGITGPARESAPAAADVPAAAAAGTIQGTVQAAGVDQSAWDASKAWHNGAESDDPAAFYAAICAGRKAGDASNQSAWALPYRYTPDSAPNAEGVRAALSRLPGTDGLTNEAEAKAKLESLMKQVNPDYQPENVATTGQGTQEGTTMQGEQGALTIEARRSRISEISARCQEIAAAYPAAQLPGDVQAEWDQVNAERRDHEAALISVEARNRDLAEMGAAPGAADGPRDSGGRPQASAGAPSQRFGAPAVHLRGDIYDLGVIRQQARSAEELPGLYRENALRAIDEHRFPGSKSREQAQANVARLLDTIPDDTSGVLARRILATGSPGYLRAFGRALAKGNPGALGQHDAQILALGESDTGSYAVPFQLDPTVLLTSDGVVNPLRQISRVEQIVGKEYDLVTSAGVTVSRKSEFAPETDGAPTLAQPTVKAERVSGFIPFSVEIEGDWTGLQAEMMRLLVDAKDVEESAAFTNGDGTPPDASGIIATLDSGSNVNGTGGTAALGIDDPATLEDAMAPRFRTRASYMGSKTTFNAYRKLFGAQAGFATDPWNKPSQGTPGSLWGYDAYENSDMATTHATADTPLILGDFGRGFLIVDRIGMNMELVPHLFGSAQGQYPTGRRGYYAWWRNNSVVLIPNAFRLLVVT